MSNAHAHEIISNLWLGDVHSSRNINFHKYYNINAVFNCSKNLPFIEGLNQKHYRIPVHDNLEEDEIVTMGDVSFQSVALLDKELRKGRKVLVHCYAGAQRSAALVVMYLMFRYNMTPAKAVEKVKKMRPQAFPRSINFRKAIDFFYTTLQEYRNHNL